MEQVSFKDGTGVYAVKLPEAFRFDPAAVKKAVGRFTLDRTDLKVAGEVAQDDKGAWLTSKAGVKFLLANRPKKNDKDSPPDVLARIAEGLKAGKTAFSISGEMKESKEAMTLYLESAEVVEKKETK